MYENPNTQLVFYRYRLTFLKIYLYFYGLLLFIVWQISGHFGGVYQSHYSKSVGAFLLSFVYVMHLNIKSKLGNKMYLWMIFTFAHLNRIDLQIAVPWSFSDFFLSRTRCDLSRVSSIWISPITLLNRLYGEWTHPCWYLFHLEFTLYFPVYGLYCYFWHDCTPVSDSTWCRNIRTLKNKTYPCKHGPGSFCQNIW